MKNNIKKKLDKINKKDTLKRYSHYEKRGELVQFINCKIVVPTEEDKEQILATSKYLHDFGMQDKKGNYCGLNSDILGVNLFMHIYTSPDFIIVDPTQFK